LKTKHTPETAARAVRSMFGESIPKTWEQYFAPGFKLNSYSATKIAQEQCNSIDRVKGRVADGPHSFEECSRALAVEIPELFAEYWEALPMSG
jgi:hypothetical protein